MIYWDNNATTQPAPEVVQAMMPYLTERFFNPSAAYGSAKAVKRAIETAREQVAALIGADADEIVFTSGGTEATNAALSQFNNVLTTATEHPATLRTAKGDAAPVMANGQVDLSTWKELLPGHDGVSFAWANHETGVIQPVRSLARAAREAGARVHVDLVQAAGKIPVRIHDVEVDYASLAAHKLHGPKGVGALFIRRGVEWHPLLSGGAQEDYRRAGTENVPGIIGFGKAAEMALAASAQYAALASLRIRFLAGLRNAGLEVVEAGAAAPRLPHVFNMSIPGITAESLTLLLEPMGLICSSGSACTSAEPHPSHVLQAMGMSDKHIRESLRFSLNRYTTSQEVDEAVAVFRKAVEKIRSVQSSVTGPVMVYR